jgi:hypothetical protein
LDFLNDESDEEFLGFTADDVNGNGRQERDTVYFSDISVSSPSSSSESEEEGVEEENPPAPGARRKIKAQSLKFC